MRRPVEGEVHVHYGQIYVESDPENHGPGLAEAFAGQRAGLCGAATPGALWLNTGLHTGDVGFTVEVCDQAPPLDPAWEDVVEVSFRPASAQSALVQWAGEASWDLGLEETDYRVRYCARGMDRASEEDTRLGDEPQLDRYLLQFWPAPPQPDRVLKETSQIAAYWHRYARTLPPPPTPAERAEAARRERLARETAEREQRLAHERRHWGGRLPSDGLRTVGGNVSGLRDFDPALLHALDAAGPVTQRAVARFAARRACEAAGLTALDWVAHALTALAEDRPLPPPFDDDARMWHALAADPDVPDRTVGRAVPARTAALRAGHVRGHVQAAVQEGGTVRGGPRGRRRGAAAPAAVGRGAAGLAAVGLRLGPVRRDDHHRPPGSVPPHLAAAHGPPRRDRRRRTPPAPGGSRRRLRGRRHVRRGPSGSPRGGLVLLRGAARVTGAPVHPLTIRLPSPGNASEAPRRFSSWSGSPAWRSPASATGGGRPSAT
ncbi:hypothetical protein QFZ55_000428 [Streptomyces luteogriseus]|uniref:hypothetical protein n=1 Tax=Streptomyces luteogriseus TaxID=68233 RepID=UPI002784952C|nr:hypothetical protein [Streptomyces luteogriseus]MDQ0710976.1 hypothetical protein [Streptomyces luteogriseus]